MKLPLESAGAVVMGIARPEECPQCNGTGCCIPKAHPELTVADALLDEDAGDGD